MEFEPPLVPPTPSDHAKSWDSLQQSYLDYDGDFRFRYIVERLRGTGITRRFTIGEAFLQDRNCLTGRGLYFTIAHYGQLFSNVPYVVAYPTTDYNETHCLGIDYVNGGETIESHVCRPRKEIPCLLTLLERLHSDTTGQP